MLVPLKPGEFEVWVELQDPPYLLLVIGRDISPMRFDVLDPQENRRVVFSSTDYQEVATWLAEDEFRPVNGRTAVDEGVWGGHLDGAI